MQKTIIDEGNIANRTFLKILKGTAISIGITLLLLLIFAVVLTYTEISENAMPVVIIAISGVSILIGSSISTLKIKKNGMIHGALSGFFYMVIIYALSSIENGFLLNSTAFIMIGVSIFMGAIGGIVGVNIK